MTYNESDCLQQALQGSDEAFTALVERYQTPVYNLCYRMLGSPQEAEDAAQETFWRAYQHLHRYDPNRSFATWLLSIAAHYCIDQQRRSRAVLIPLDGMIEEIMADPAPLPERSAARSQEATALRQILNSLNPQDRAAIVLRYWYDFSEEEIANALALTVSAVKSRLHRARQALGQRWQALEAQNAAQERRPDESPAY